MRVALFTAIYGEYDNFQLPTKQNYPVDFFYFSEHEIQKYDLQTRQLVDIYNPIDLWSIKRYLIKPNDNNLNKMNSILLRTDHHNNPYLKDYDLVIYIDGNMVIDRANFIEQYFVKVLENNPDLDIILTKHPDRNCIYQERRASTMPKYSNTDFDRMLKFYQEIKPNSGLYWNGLMGYNNKKDLSKFNELYAYELFKYAKNPDLPYHPQGQITLPYCFKKCEIKVYAHRPVYNTVVKSRWHCK